MRYQDRDALVAGLREAADFIEARGVELPINTYDIECGVTTWMYGDAFENRLKLRKIAKVLGKAEKVYSGGYFDIKRNFGPFHIKFTADRKVVCEAKVVGQKVIPAREATPEKIVDKIEWVCTDPLLKETA
jgi:hypothetical protein